MMLKAREDWEEGEYVVQGHGGPTYADDDERQQTRKGKRDVDCILWDARVWSDLCEEGVEREALWMGQ